MEDLISVVVPVYNVEKYLGICIESIIQQTYKNIEVILIDDGSTDNSGAICDEYAKKDERIKVIHKKNGGLSDARNKGIDKATGKYIAFIDSDDYIDRYYLEKLYYAITKFNTKIAQCNIQKIDENSNKLEIIGDETEKIKDSQTMIKELCNSKWENTVAWNKLYLRQLFDEIRYPIGKIHEDEFTTYKILYEIEKMAIIPEYLYFYRQRRESIMNQKFDLRRLDNLEAWEERLKFFKEKNENTFYNLTLQGYLQNLKGSYLKVRLYIKESKSVQNELLQKYKNNYLKLLKIKEVPMSIKIKCSLFYYAPNLWYIIKKKENNGEKIIKEN